MTDKMQVGVRYCGGCNSRYNRGAMVKRLCGKHPEWESENAKEGREYDLLLVIGGCSSCCAAYDQFDAKKVIKIWEDIEEII